MKLLYIGDVSTRRGREALRSLIPKIKSKHKPDFIIANVENSAGGRGVTREKIYEMSSYGIDLMTSGDHTFGIQDFEEDLSTELPLIIPANYEAQLPGNNFQIVEIGGKRVAFVCVLGQSFMPSGDLVRNPFYFMDELLETDDFKTADQIIVEVHTETATEKLSLAWYLKDRVSAVVGTHTHVATADNRLLGGKVAYVSDIGQVGPYDASLWVDFENVIHNFRYPTRRKFKIAEDGPMVFNSVLLTLSDTKKISPLSIDRVDLVFEE